MWKIHAWENVSILVRVPYLALLFERLFGFWEKHLPDDKASFDTLTRKDFLFTLESSGHFYVGLLDVEPVTSYYC